ncbi:MFS transporter [Planobispora longispora]|uniref:Uncharacterized protein n=1 Tax=Planobispora longispora TaxID=28887 RepID=A0A8J3RWN3_9ACTN|nr:MFS transporter [Planobispora longispora]BFE78178.1 hypothetical protein GCM10020093_007790 [Planobispora longispora]GIH80889.1 hypothetical protein Plo01_73180 [Planobispora longispora]
MPASSFLRLARAAVFTTVGLGLSLAAHLLAGGPVSVGGAAGGLALTFAAALAAAGRERSTALILPFLAGVQVALHALFSLTHAAPATELAGHAHTGLVPGLGMLIMHGWAVALTALWLARGEAALWALLRRLPLRLRRLLLAHALPEPEPSFVPPATVPRVRHSVRLRHAVPRRGPPRRVDAAFG